MDRVFLDAVVRRQQIGGVLILPPADCLKSHLNRPTEPDPLF